MWHIILELSDELKESFVSEGSNGSAVEYIDKLTQSLLEQQKLLSSLLTTQKEKLKSHSRLVALNKSVEEVIDCRLIVDDVGVSRC